MRTTSTDESSCERKCAQRASNGWVWWSSQQRRQEKKTVRMCKKCCWCHQAPHMQFFMHETRCKGSRRLLKPSKQSSYQNSAHTRIRTARATQSQFMHIKLWVCWPRVLFPLTLTPKNSPHHHLSHTHSCSLSFSRSICHVNVLCTSVHIHNLLLHTFKRTHRVKWDINI